MIPLLKPAKLRRWLHEHSLRLLAIRDTPQAIAGGVAIGIFFGFMPLFGIKTVSAIFFAWLTGSNILAAVIAGALHDLIIPLMPIVYRWEYNIGYWLLSAPHHWPPALSKLNWEGQAWREWRTLFTIGKPLLLGGAVVSAPFTVLSFFLTQWVVVRHRRKKLLLPAPDPDEINPS